LSYFSLSVAGKRRPAVRCVFGHVSVSVVPPLV
jgi:hypothetical protein